jgi:hypothetical protein
MPVLSEPPYHGIANLPDITVIYVFLGVFLLALLGVFIRRRSKTTQFSIMASASEKEPLMNNNNANYNNNENENTGPESQSAALGSPAKPRIQRPPQPPPFTPPTLAESPTEMIFSSFEAMEMPPAPRRRSYTKTMADGTEVSGEIIVAEGWRRHTRVFGGGVCKACEESERRMTA